MHELNQKYAAPDGFLLMDDFARVRKPKDQTHLERSHRTFHQFEFLVIREFSDRIAERVPGVKFKTDGSRENITVTRLKATLSDLMMSGIIEKYRQQHNQSVHQFSEQGERSKWAPEQRLTDYLDSVETLNFGETEVEIFYKYGAPKSPATVSKSGSITYKNQQFNVVSGEFSRHSSTKVKISAYEGKLFIFEDKDDGVCLGEAVPVKAPENSEEIITSRVKRKVKQNEFEMIRIFLENRGLVINQEKLLIMYQQGLTLEISMLLINQHQSEYEKYNERGKGFLSFNLFASHVSEYLSQGQKFKPYAQVKAS